MDDYSKIAEENGKVLLGIVNGQPLYGTCFTTASWVSNNTSDPPPWIPQKTDDEIIADYIKEKFKR